MFNCAQFYISRQVHIAVQTSPLAVFVNLHLILKNAERLKNCLPNLKKQRSDSNSKPSCSITGSKSMFYKGKLFLGFAFQYINADYYDIDLKSGRFSMCSETRPWTASAPSHC